jgi:glycosyltransferase involved in cell wall biosynthesis
MSEAFKIERIAVLLQSLEGGGAQRRVIDLANGFVRRGCKIDLFLAEQKGVLGDGLARGIRTFPASVLPRYLGFNPPDALLSGAAVVHPLAVKSLPTRRNFPLVLRASSNPHRYLPWSMPRERLVEMARRVRRMRHYSSADLIIAVADDVAEVLRDALPDKTIEVIPNQVVTEQFLSGISRPIDYPWPGRKAVPLIVGVGRLALAKDYPTLLRAFALVRQTRPVRLAILGGGSSREQHRLFVLAEKLGIRRDFALLGECDHVAAWLARANLFVSSSLWEGSPAALIEAVAVGCPVIATETVGIAREILADTELGSLVQPRQPRMMAEAIVERLDRSHDKERLRAAAQPYRLDRAGDYLLAMGRCAARLNQVDS